jgi:hypothetical protein
MYILLSVNTKKKKKLLNDKKCSMQKDTQSIENKEFISCHDTEKAFGGSGLFVAARCSLDRCGTAEFQLADGHCDSSGAGAAGQ